MFVMLLLLGNISAREAYRQFMATDSWSFLHILIGILFEHETQNIHRKY